MEPEFEPRQSCSRPPEPGGIAVRGGSSGKEKSAECFSLGRNQPGKKAGGVGEYRAGTVGRPRNMSSPAVCSYSKKASATGAQIMEER